MSYYQQIFEEFPLAKEIWEKKYRYKDETIEGTWRRVAKAVASVEKESTYWEEQFFNILNEGYFVPGGRITNGIDTENPYLMNCFCIFLEDNIESIYDSIKKIAVISKKQGGVGFLASTLRPKGTKLSDGGIASGPVSFLEIINTSCDVIKTGSQNRRAALLSNFEIRHPDILEYINSKREDGKLTNFNISVSIDDEFMSALERDDYIELKFDNIVYQKVKAKEIWDALVDSGWKWNDPGILWYDNINNKNDMKYLYSLQSTNP